MIKVIDYIGSKKNAELTGTERALQALAQGGFIEASAIKSVETPVVYDEDSYLAYLINLPMASAIARSFTTPVGKTSNEVHTNAFVNNPKVHVQALLQHINKNVAENGLSTEDGSVLFVLVGKHAAKAAKSFKAKQFAEINEKCTVRVVKKLKEENVSEVIDMITNEYSEKNYSRVIVIVSDKNRKVGEVICEAGERLTHNELPGLPKPNVIVLGIRKCEPYSE